MAKTRAAKVAEVEYVADRLRRSVSAILADFRGLNVAEVTELRRRLRAAGVEYRVVKNTLALRAARGVGIDGLDGLLRGPTAIAFSREDPTVAAREMAAFAREHPALQLKGGIVEGRVVGMAEVRALADLPPREVLLSRVLGAFKGPLAGLAIVLAAPLRGFVTGVEELRKKREAA